MAPSPTGALHIGNARTFLVNWALARQRGWSIVLRIEDLDGPRVKRGAAEGIARTLSWLGMDWDEGPVVQSADLAPYQAAARRLILAGLAYRSDLSRGDVLAAASAPQSGDVGQEARFPPELRPPDALVPGRWGPEPDLAAGAWRFATPAGPAGEVEFDDELAGRVRVRVAEDVGDFVIWTRANVPAYQLAVVVDDDRQGVTHVVRGDDLLGSTGRQALVARGLGLGAAPGGVRPSYVHLPLVVGPDGRRLAKRHGDSRVDTYREAGVPAEAVIGEVAWLCGLSPGGRQPMTAAEFCRLLRLDTIPRNPAVFAEEDHRWLISQAR